MTKPSKRSTQLPVISNCNTCDGCFLVSHASKLVLKIVANCVSNYSEAQEVLPEEQLVSRPQRSTADTLFFRSTPVPGVGTTKENDMCFINLQKADGSPDRELPQQALARAGVPDKTIAVIRLFHDGMLAPSPHG